MLNLGKKFLPFRLKQIYKNNKVARTTVPFYAAKSIGLLYSVDDRNKHDALVDFVRQLENDGKEVTVLGFLEKGKENFDYRFDFFTSESLSVTGVIKAENVKTFAVQTFDYLINMDISSNHFISYILAMSKARCRVGRFSEEQKQYLELMIKIPEGSGIRDLIWQLNHYMKQFN